MDDKKSTHFVIFRNLMHIKFSILRVQKEDRKKLVRTREKTQQQQKVLNLDKERKNSFKNI